MGRRRKSYNLPEQSIRLCVPPPETECSTSSCLLLDIPPQSHPRYPKRFAYFLNRVAFVLIQFSCHFHLLVSEGFRPPAFDASRAGCGKACLCAFLDKVSSNSASAPKIWKISFPPEVVVSMFSERLLKPILRWSSFAMISIRSLSDLPSLSSRQTTRTSVARTYSSAS